MKDYRVKLSVRNNRILRLIEGAGFESVKSFCDFFVLPYNSVNEIIGMRAKLCYNSPKHGTGFTNAVKNLAEALGVNAEEMFSDEQLEIHLNKSTAEAEFNREQMRALVGGDSGYKALDDKDKIKRVNECLAVLNDKERKVLSTRFGIMGGSDHTYEEIARQHSVTRERIRQIEYNAIAKIRKAAANGKI